VPGQPTEGDADKDEPSTPVADDGHKDEADLAEPPPDEPDTEPAPEGG
jgi:hypothetical protein